MKTVVAASVLYGREAFASLGAVDVAPDRDITARRLKDADALVIRSKTTVNAALLEGTRVAFIGTATAGFDHMDIAELERRGVAWCSAPGCNATSVAEYIVSALLCLSRRHGFPLEGRVLGVIGVGHVGARVVRLATALGLRVLQNDPPRALIEGDAVLRPLDEILPELDLVTLHVPLQNAGAFATRRMVNCRFLSRLKPGAVFLNTSRGEVVDESALKLALARGQVRNAVLDVWENEPDPDPELVRAVTLGTPHIAGYSWDGKREGTRMVYQEACRFFECVPSWTPPGEEESGPARPPEGVWNGTGKTDAEAVCEIVRAAYDITRDDRDFRGPDLDRASRAILFEHLRKRYGVRREFSAMRLRAAGLSAGAERRLKSLGFCRVGPG